ncbi:transcriptional regulator [Aquitalea magnusonii]|nr:transcriptional regulator [Aquitalea magnusonii]
MSSSIDLRQLRYFLAVSEELNFGRAARRLHISQPPLSRQIRQLEDQLGVELFQRNKAGVTLTQAGAAFLPEVRRTLAQAEKAIAVARATRATNGGQFVVGYTTVFDRSAIPDVVDQLRPIFPNWSIATKGKHSINLVRDIKSGAMDVAFIGLHTETQGLKVETIFEESFVVALSSKHRLAQKRRLCFEDLHGEPIFWFERRLNPGFYDYCQAFFEKIGFKPNTIAEPADHHIMLGLISEGQGIALIPMSLRKVRYQGVAFREIDEDREKLSIGIGVAYSEHNQSPVLHTFLELVRQAR